MHTVHRKQLLFDLRRLVDKMADTVIGKEILENVRKLLLVGLAESNNFVEVLVRRVLLDEYLQEAGGHDGILALKRTVNIDDCFSDAHEFSTVLPSSPDSTAVLTEEEFAHCCAILL